MQLRRRGGEAPAAVDRVQHLQGFEGDPHARNSRSKKLIVPVGNLGWKYAAAVPILMQDG